MLAERRLPTLRDRYLALRSIPAFEPLEAEGLLALAESSRFARFEGGQFIAREGEPIHEVFIVLEGRVEVRTGKRLMTDDARTVGFVSVVGNDPYGMSAYAHTDVLALSLPRDVFLDVFESDSSLLRAGILNAARTSLEARRQLPPLLPEPEHVPELPDRPMTFVEKMLSTRELPLLKGASVEAVADLAAASREVYLQSGDCLFKVGDSAEFSFRVLVGRLRCTTATGESRDVGPEIVLGALDVASQLPRSYTAQALTPVTGFEIRSDDFFAMIERHPDVGMNLLGLLSRQIMAAAR